MVIPLWWGLYFGGPPRQLLEKPQAGTGGKPGWIYNQKLKNDYHSQQVPPNFVLILTLQEPRAGHAEYGAGLISQTEFSLIIVNDSRSKVEFGKVIHGMKDYQRIEFLQHAVPLGEDRAHFEAARPGALVILAYPTPTLLYRIARRSADLLRLWRFPDERPLTRREVVNEARKYGKIVYSTIHWGVVFTQAVTAVIVADPKDAV